MVEEDLDVPVFDGPETNRGPYVVDFGHLQSLLASMVPTIPPSADTLPPEESSRWFILTNWSVSTEAGFADVV
ncbi:hypothetical protein [Aeromicrobium ginsengisoli]|uniref:hypothetical protein n=1 Tax=Aeromicrobium ginsengisoli TaxID=363867 RepID=UPI00165F3B50|nr:hypothetical protein [Aeromicrobium ginsengisoli]